MIIDTHAHYDDDSFDEDRDSLLSGMPEGGVEKVINAGASAASALYGLALSEKYPHVFCALGVHPNEIRPGEPGGLTEEVLEEFAVKSRHPKVVAIGEIGLEYHYEDPARDIQRHWFRRQIALAKRVGLPIIVHSREATQETYDIIREEHAEEAGGVIHCFSGGPDTAVDYVKLGFYIGIGGVVTFKNGKKMKEVVKRVPLTSILLETDSPYLAPEPYRGKRNCSLYLPYVAREIAALKGVTEEEVVAVTKENAERCFPKLRTAVC